MVETATTPRDQLELPDADKAFFAFLGRRLIPIRRCLQREVLNLSST